MHEGHRNRLKEQFLKNGLENFQPHNVLELLLFYTIPRKDTNEIAHRLINEFGSLSGVFDAPLTELTKVDGVGEHTATLIKLIPELLRVYSTDKFSGGIVISNREELYEFIKAEYIGCVNEKLLCLCFDNNGKLKQCACISEGTETVAEVNVKKIVQISLKTNASKIIVAHNHHNGVAAPSYQDIKVTSDLYKVLSPIGCNLVDHIIVAGNDCFSMASSKKFAPIFLGMNISGK
ncbi:MAG: DNA repair protein RadC [Clostridiales bacterium]|nr:DNA repair protein RadC [Clostridiales bacterium]